MKIVRLNKSILLCGLLVSCAPLPAQKVALQNACQDAQVPVIFQDRTTDSGIQASNVSIQHPGYYQYTPVSVDPNGVLHCKVTFTGNYTSSDNTYTYQHAVVAGFQFAQTPATPGMMALGVMPSYDSRSQQVTMDTQPTIQSDTITGKMTNVAVKEQNEQEQKEDEGIAKLYQIANCQLWVRDANGKLECAVQKLPW